MDSCVRIMCTSSFTEPTVSKTLSVCGKILGVYPYPRETSVYFVHFNDTASAERALKTKFTGLHIHSIAKNPQYLEQYRSVNPAAVDAFLRASEKTKNNLQNIPIILPKRSRDKQRHRHKSRSLSRYSYDSVSPFTSASHNKDSPLIFRILQTPISQASTISVEEQSRCAPPPPQPFALSSSISHSETRVSMNLCGEYFSYDLETLDPDPTAIITLLEKTNSDRGTWMIVSAYYRRLGNPSAATRVVTTLIDAMMAHDVPENDLKPAFLLLSGCELDMSRKGGQNAAEHQKKSVSWLQKVYGTCVLPANNPPVTQACPDAEKRKLDDELAFERETRRKLEKDLASMTKERDHARKMESFAQEQVKREVDTRRRAEAKAEREHGRRVEAERRIAF